MKYEEQPLRASKKSRKISLTNVEFEMFVQLKLITLTTMLVIYMQLQTWSGMKTTNRTSVPRTLIRTRIFLTC